MKIHYLVIKQGLFSKKFELSVCANHVFSKENASGKTTLLRMLLYALGYSVPSTKGIDFSKYEFETYVESNSEKYVLFRKKYTFYITYNNVIKEYSLPYDFYIIQKKITSINNEKIIDNLLGTFYIDQEKGWTLLNRGKVIGDISFNIEEFVRALSGIDCDNEINECDSIEKQIKKYKYMCMVAKYQELIKESGDVNDCTEYDDKYEEFEMLELEKSNITKEIKQIDKVLKANRLIADYIDDMDLIVESKSGERIIVSKKTLVSYSDNNNFLKVKKKMLRNDLLEISNKISKLKNKNKERKRKTKEIINSFDADISKISIDYYYIQKIINDLKQRKSELNNLINSRTRNAEVVSLIYEYICKYAKMLNIDNKFLYNKKEYIFTKDLKSLSGSVLRRIVFAFKISYIRIIREKFNVVLPIILDSPAGNEISDKIINNMIKILEKDFSKHQIIIASIGELNINNKTILAVNKDIDVFL